MITSHWPARLSAPVGREQAAGRETAAGRGTAGHSLAAGHEPAARRGPLLRLLWLAGPLRGRLLLAVAAGAAATGCAVALLGVSGFLLARASQHPGIIAISGAVVAVRGLSVGRGVFRYAERLASHDVAFRILADVRVMIYRRLEALAPAGLAGLRSGDLTARLVSDVDATQDVFIRGIVPPLTALLVGAGAVLACLLLLAPAGLLLAAALLLAGLAVPALAATAARRAAAGTGPARGELAATMTDLLAGAADLHAFGAQDQALARLASTDEDLTGLARRFALGSGAGAGMMSAVAGLALWGVLLLGVAAVGAGTLTRVPLAVLTLTALAAFEAVSALPAAVLQLGHARSSAARIASVLDAADPVAEPAEPLRGPGQVHVMLRGAQARYRSDGPLAIDGIDLDLPAGRRVALVGPSGAGKSTVAALLLRFCELAGGTATINGASLASYASDDVRAVIGGCTQDPHIFNTSIGENLRLARPEATAGELAAAAAAARLLPWVQSLPDGWHTPAGARGAALSGGQRQRLALARALLAGPAVLVLDEPAAHLESQARRALTADLLAATRGRTTLLITHDLDGLDQVDEVVVLDRGTVAERGTHAELLAACGRYRQMWDSQMLVSQMLDSQMLDSQMLDSQMLDSQMLDSAAGG